MSLFGKLFNSDKKDTSYNGPRPYGSLLDAAGGKDYYNTILGRSQGQGTGYGDAYTSYANPQMEQLHNQYTGYQLPELKSELTATGRRAGSSGFQQIARSQSDEADKENSIMAQLSRENAQAQNADKNTAISQLGAFNTGDYNARNILSNFDNADNNRQVQEANATRQNQAQGLQQLGQAGVQLLLGQNSPQTFNPMQQQVQSRQPDYSYLNQPSNYNNYTNLASKYAQLGRV